MSEPNATEEAIMILDELIASFCNKSNMSAVELVRCGLHALGFDIFHGFPIQSYNKTLVKSTKGLLPLIEYERGQTQSILIGNTKHLWPIFINELTAKPKKWKNEPHPLNQYTLYCVQSVCDKYLKQNNIEYTLRFTFETQKDKLIAFQRLCHVSKCAFLDENAYLCIHSQYGPWMALRALIVLDKDWNDIKQQKHKNLELADLCTPKEQENVKKQWQEIQNVFDKKEKNDCQPMESWRYWLKLRDAYDIGKQHRYSEEQILYHYTADLTVLQNICQWELNKKRLSKFNITLRTMNVDTNKVKL